MNANRTGLGRATEVGLIVDVVADTQDLATRAGQPGRADRVALRLHRPPGRGRQLRLPVFPERVPVGPVYEWSVWHILDVDDEREPFHTELVELG